MHDLNGKDDHSTTAEIKSNSFGKLLLPEGWPLLFQGFVGVTSLVYFFGYLNWSNYAIRNKLGFIPLLREQYLVAGFLPFILTVAYFSVVYKYDEVVEFLFNRYKNHFIRFATYYSIVFLVVGFCGLAANVAYFFNVELFSDKTLLSNLLFTCINLLVFASFVYHSILNKESTAGPLNVKLIAIITIFLVYRQLAVIYNDRVFPNLPRAIGGPQVTCVTLDIDKSSFSQNTLNIFQQQTGDTFLNVIRTKPIYLVFDAGDMVYLKQNDRMIDSSNHLMQIKKSAIQGIYDCY